MSGQECSGNGTQATEFLDLGAAFPAGSFDAVYALNCLLHVPTADLPAVLPAVLAQIRTVLRPGGLFFLGVYAGDGSQGMVENDSHTPARFHSWRTDEQIQEFAGASFQIVDFHTVDLENFVFQPLTSRRAIKPRPGS